MSKRLWNILRPGWLTVWKQFCEETGGILSKERGKGLRKTQIIRVDYKNWVIKIDAPKKGKRATLTRVRAAYFNADSFYFRIYREGLFQGLQKKFGLEDLVIGYPDFDENFIIQGNDLRKLKALFSSESIRQIISWQPDIHLKNIVDEDWKINPEQQGISVLEFKVMGLISDLDRLRDLHELFQELLDQLVKIGSAHEKGPLSET